MAIKIYSSGNRQNPQITHFATLALLLYVSTYFTDISKIYLRPRKSFHMWRRRSQKSYPSARIKYGGNFNKVLWYVWAVLITDVLHEKCIDVRHRKYFRFRHENREWFVMFNENERYILEFCYGVSYRPQLKHRWKGRDRSKQLLWNRNKEHIGTTKVISDLSQK